MLPPLFINSSHCLPHQVQIYFMHYNVCYSVTAYLSYLVRCTALECIHLLLRLLLSSNGCFLLPSLTNYLFPSTHYLIKFIKILNVQNKIHIIICTYNIRVTSDGLYYIIINHIMQLFFINNFIFY